MGRFEFAFDEVLPTIRSYEEVVADPLPPLAVLLDGLLLEKGRLVIGGDPGVGKSILVSQLCYCLASGSRFLNMGSIEPMRVMYAQAELPAQMVETRLRAQDREFARLMRPGYLYHYTADPWDWDYQLPLLVNACLERHIEVLALDPLSAMLPPELDENSNKDINYFCRQVLAGLQAHCNLRALLIVHHFNKPNEFNVRSAPLARLSGAYSLARWTDAFIAMIASRQDNEATLIFDKVRAFPPKPSLLVVRHDDTLTYTAETGYDDLLWKAMDTGRHYTRDEMQAILNEEGLPAKKANMVINKMRIDGLVTTNGKQYVRREDAGQ